MANRSGFSCSLEGLEVITSALDAYVEDIDERIDKALGEAADNVVHDARELEPWLSGDLIGATFREDVKKSGDTLYVDIGVSSEIKYAVRMHEDVYNPGEKTRSAPVNSPRVGGQKRGRKYLERALKANEKPFVEGLSKILDQE